ncbi:BA14K family protein [Aminobacter sp. HY435]|uniref:BA14K family protein n=1 Tax=Aminobacter sp. HY435 TaxID=2970917 RepID=UPI0022B95E4F|nr:BA14K family protein [Aminobacter sp. HY435]
MRRELSVLVRSGLVAVSMVIGLPLVAAASPAGIIRTPAALPASVEAPIQVDNRRCEFVPGCRNYRDGWRHGNWRGDRWRDDRRWRHRPYRRNHWSGTGIYLNFSIPAYRYYEPRYYQPRYYQPRRVYRPGRLSSAHVQWCYDRYRSYRAWDNTFQPYNGPRRQCWSPYG